MSARSLGAPTIHIQDLIALIGRGTYESVLTSANLSVDAALPVVMGEEAVYALGRPPSLNAP